MTEMIERVAKAIQSALSEGTPGRDPDRMERIARAAIEAMRDPTEAMIDKGYDHVDYGGTDIEAAWKDMIDAALK